MIQEPPTTFDLWPRVKALSEWPDTDETRMAALGEYYTAMGTSHARAAEVRTDAAATSWTDDAGTLFVTRVGEATRRAGLLADEMNRLGFRATQFAETVVSVKNGIHELIGEGITRYASYDMLPAGTRERFQETLVTTLATEVNERVGNAAAGLAAEPAANEYGTIQQFMFDEMVRNANSSTTDWLKLHNATGNKLAAYAFWIEKVASRRDWDHKQDILDRTAGGNTATPLPNGNGNIRYDAWSNIHYGYVGKEAGFTDFELRKGADAADLVDNQATDPGDDLTIRIGIELREQYAPDELRPEHIEQAIERHRAELEQYDMIRPTVK